MTAVTQADLARHLGTTRSYITALKAADRLVCLDGGKIDLEASLTRIEATRDPSVRMSPNATPAPALACCWPSLRPSNPSPSHHPR